MAEPAPSDDKCPNCKIPNAIVGHSYSFWRGFRFVMVCPNCAVVHESSEAPVKWWTRSPFFRKRRYYGMRPSVKPDRS